MPDLETAIIQMYEDISLTDELTDKAAQVLLKWGEKQVETLVETYPNEMVFEVYYKQLRRLMRAINRFLGQRPHMDAQRQLDYMEKIIEPAQVMGFTLSPERIQTYIEQPAIADNPVEALLDLFERVEADTSVPEPESAPIAASAPVSTPDKPQERRRGLSRLLQSKEEEEILLQTIMTCPECGQTREETMPTDQREFLYQCHNCATFLRPKLGDHCVYCSYGSVKCPLEQRKV